MRFTVTNNQHETLIFESLAFDLGDKLKLDNGAPKKGAGNKYRPELLTQLFKSDGTKEDSYSDRYIIEPGQTVVSWVPLDRSIGKAVVEDLGTPWGVWHYRCTWQRESVTAYKYAEPL